MLSPKSKLYSKNESLNDHVTKSQLRAYSYIDPFSVFSPLLYGVHNTFFMTHNTSFDNTPL